MYNQSTFNWDKVKRYLLNQGNITLDIQELQRDILSMFNKKLDVITGSSLLNAIADGLSSLNPLKQIKSYGYGLIISCNVLLIIKFYLCIVWRRTLKKQQQQLAFLTIFSYLQKQKGGDVGDRPTKRPDKRIKQSC